MTEDDLEAIADIVFRIQTGDPRAYGDWLLAWQRVKAALREPETCPRCGRPFDGVHCSYECWRAEHERLVLVKGGKP